MINLRKTVVLTASALALGSLAVGPLSAARDPAYAAARAAGQVGEQPDGYLGIVGQATAELQRLVDDINIKRRAVYAKKAQENNATVEQFAFTSGCQAIGRTVPGEKYQTPNGTWNTRTDAAPTRDPRCP